MKNDFLYEIFPTFVVRTPMLPFNFVQNLLSDEKFEKNNLKKIICQPVINEALFIAAPEFHEQLQKWLNGNVLKEKEEVRILQTLYKYLSRMATRSTPFGLFAGCTTGFIDDKTGIVLLKSSEHKRHTRLDMLYLCNLSSALSKHPKIKGKLNYYPNTSLYELGEQLRYIESRNYKDKRTHHLVQIKNSPYVELIIKKVKNGETIKNLVKTLENKGVSIAHAEMFIDKLIDNQVIISELDPTVTGDEFLHRIIKILNLFDDIDEIKATLNKINNKILNIDNQIGNAQFIYLDIEEDIKTLGIDYNINYLFQTDMSLVTQESSVNKSLRESLLQGICILNKFTNINYETNIQRFKKAFALRYESREVSLLKALDTETGIGYLQNDKNSDGDVSPLIADIVITSKQNESIQMNMDAFQSFLFKKLLEANAKNSFEIELTDNDLKEFEVNWNDLPITFSAKVSIIEGSSEFSPEGKLLLEGAGNSSAANLLGRFCHGNEKIYQCVKEITDYEKKLLPDIILAEIVHLPESRIGNVILRPILRDYEIPLLTTPAVDPVHTISLDDLFISIYKEEIVLRSKRLNKRVIPRMSNAHNYSANALPVYQFLCDLQHQNIRLSMGFDWGHFYNNHPFKPRLIYKNLILSPAIWFINIEEIHEFCKMKNNSELLDGIEKWRNQRNIPQTVLLEEVDNLLYVDFCNLLSIRTLFSSVNRKKSFILKEFLFNPDNAVVKSEEGVFTNEFIFGFYKKDTINDEK